MRTALKGFPLYLLVLCVVALAFSFSFTACSPPTGVVPDTLSTNKCQTDWGDSVAVVRSTIRFEAQVDTSLYPLERFSESGLRIAVVCIPPDTSSLPYLDLYSVSANYLDIPATGLPFTTKIPARYFSHYGCTRVAVSVILLYSDVNANGHFEAGEPVYGAGEQSLYAYAEGTVSNDDIRGTPYESLQLFSNVLVRVAVNPAPRFRPAPDYRATIFLINVRGDAASYELPYPWEPVHPLLP
ncbi:hypothetical protein KQI65_02340 [bacterium]|nr:hypothetical protein [bacterium]